MWELWQGLDIVIHNAGVDLLTGEKAQLSFIDKWNELSVVDILATMTITRELGQRMADGHGGSIVTIGWDQAEVGMAGDSGQLFGAAKSAIIAYTKSLARSLAPRVRVNCLSPGWIRTAWGELASPEWQQRVYDETLLQRWGLPEDVAHAARWLVSPRTDYLTGQVIRINGGGVC